MPFAFRLGIKKVRRYDVARKALFVLPVQLLDNSVMECTMNDNSTAQELLTHIAQRLNIRQGDYFGLKFINKHLQYQWLALDVGLKRQLSKFAHDHFVKFSVRFYMRNVNELKDEATRYQFFLQLRNEIIEGALLCSAEEAVLLASYSLQAAYGDFDPERHSPHHLKDFFLLPKRMCTQEDILRDLLMEVTNTHRSLQRMSPASAEMFYIIEAQNLEGYGEEYYAAKDASGNDLLLGTSYMGITIKHPTGRPLLSISWNNLKTVTRSKRSICLECAGNGRTNQRMVQIFLENPDFAAYVLTNVMLQQEFYLSDQNVPVPSSSSSLTNGHHHHGQHGLHNSIQPVLQPGLKLMFRPDPSGVMPGGLHRHAEARPDVVDFGRGREPSGYLPQLEPPDWPRRKLEDPSSSAHPFVYRESPSYDAVMQNHSRDPVLLEGPQHGRALDLLQHANAHPVSYLRHRLSLIAPGEVHEAAGNEHRVLMHHPGNGGLNEVNGGVYARFPLTHIQHQATVIGPHTNSTPELSSVRENMRVARHNHIMSCSTPDLLSMTGPVPMRRVLMTRPQKADVFVSHSTEVHMVRQVGVDNLSTPVAYTSSTFNLDKVKHFDTLPEEESPPTENPAPSTTLPTSVTLNPTPPEHPSRPLLMAAMNGLVLSNRYLNESHHNRSLPDSYVLHNKDARRQDLEQRLSSGSVLIEFEQIPKKRPTNNVCTVGSLPENAPRNRLSDVLPYEDTRVQLLNTSNKKNPKGYINASDIVLKCGDVERRYFATQEPIPNGTMDDFLNMIWQYHIKLIVALSDSPCLPWSQFAKEGKTEVSVEGFQLRKESVSKGDGYSIFCFWLNSKSGKHGRRKIWSLHFEAWAEQGIPADTGQFCRMIQELESFRLQFQQAKEPVLVVCKTGTGRSGTMILFDFMTLCLDHNQPVDVPRVLAGMRMQRMYMVQTVSQYRFVYAALVQHLNSSRLI